VSLRAKIGLISLLICTLVAGGLGAYSYTSQRQRFETDMHSETEAVGRRLLVSLPGPLYDFALPQIARILDAEMSCRHVASLVVLDGNDAFVAGRARDEQWKPMALKAVKAGGESAR